MRKCATSHMTIDNSAERHLAPWNQAYNRAFTLIYKYVILEPVVMGIARKIYTRRVLFYLHTIVLRAIKRINIDRYVMCPTYALSVYIQKSDRLLEQMPRGAVCIATKPQKHNSLLHWTAIDRKRNSRQVSRPSNNISPFY